MDIIFGDIELHVSQLALVSLAIIWAIVTIVRGILEVDDED